MTRRSHNILTGCEINDIVLVGKTSVGTKRIHAPTRFIDERKIK